MIHMKARPSKIVAGTIAIGLLFAFFSWRYGAHLWHPLKERYFDYVSASCIEANGFDRIPWQEVPAFDGRVRQFVANSEKEVAVRDCIDRWASVIMEGRVSADVSYPTIEFVLTDDHLEVGSPPRQVYYAYIQPAD